MEWNCLFTYVSICYLLNIVYLSADEMDFIFGMDACLNNK